MDLHLQCRPLAEISPAKQAKTQNRTGTATVSPGVVSFLQGVDALYFSAATVSTGKGEVVANLLGAAPMASKRLA